MRGLHLTRFGFAVGADAPLTLGVRAGRRRVDSEEARLLEVHSALLAALGAGDRRHLVRTMGRAAAEARFASSTEDERRMREALQKAVDDLRAGVDHAQVAAELTAAGIAFSQLQ